MKHHTFCAAALGVAMFATALHAQQKRPIDRADQVPVHSYAITKAPSALLHDEAALAALAAAVRTDLEADLAAYDIRDTSALRSYYRALSTIAMLQHRLDEALEYENKAGALEEKPAARALSGFQLRPLIAAEKAGPARAAQAFSAALAAELARLPYDTVQAELKARRQTLGIQSPARLESRVARGIDPAAKGGHLSKELALELLNRSFTLRRMPYRDEIVRQLSALIDAHHADKPDIWAARDVSLEGRTGLTPVVLAIWDSGVDTALFPGRLWTNAKEIPGNGKDDDANGYVDDVHGIAWTRDGEPTTGDLRPLELSPADLARAKQYSNGFSDLQAGIDSPEAQALKRLLAGISKDEAKALDEVMASYGGYPHGTHVTGIAIRGNPAARILVGRMERAKTPSPSAAWAEGFARLVVRTAAYYRKAGVRVVNMSWGLSPGDLEQRLEINGIGATPQERRQLALQYYNTVKSALQAAIAAAPEILFVAAAGNSNSSNQFNEVIPASFDLPNTMTAGAVDQGGDETAFTSFGKVDLYANGFAVESVVPGGDKMRMSGTSMAAPQVVNLAAKLLAAYPRLTTAALRNLIIEGADTKDVSGGRSIRLLNEARSFELAATAPGFPQPPIPDPVYPAGFDAAMLARLVDGHLADARAAVDRLVAAGDTRTAANTLRPFDDATNDVQLAQGLTEIATLVHPDSAIRAEGIKAAERISHFRADFAADPRVARAFAALDTKGLTPEEQRLVQRVRRDYRRAGAGLDEATRARFRTLLESQERLGAEFVRNLTRDRNVSVGPGDPADLQRRRRNVVANYRRGWPANGEVLRSLLRVREEIAHLAGYRDWASYQTEIRMAGSPDEIRAFLDRIRTAAAPARKRAAAKYLERIRRVDPSVTRLGIAEVAVAGELIRREEYAFDRREVRAYFPFERVKKGVLAIASEFFGLEFRRVDLPVWEPSVEAYEAREQGHLIGRLYLDLHRRPGKIAIGFSRTLRPGITGRQLPEVMVAVGLPGGAPEDPGLTEVGGIATFFHELGHAVQSLLAVRPYVSTGGQQDEPDFREVPSLMLEDLIQQPAVLRRLSGHVETGAPIPVALLKRMQEADAFSRPMGVGQQVATATMSLELHERPADTVDPDALARQAFARDYVDLDPEMHVPTSIVHLSSAEYSANMYVFPWSQVIARDLWSRFDPANPLEPNTAQRYVDSILRPGKSRPASESVREFLGRPFDLASWRRWLEEGERR